MAILKKEETTKSTPSKSTSKTTIRPKTIPSSTQGAAKTTRRGSPTTASNSPSSPSAPPPPPLPSLCAPFPSLPSIRAPPPPLYPLLAHSSASLAIPPASFHTFPRVEKMRQLPPKRPPPPQQLLRADALSTASNSSATLCLLPQAASGPQQQSRFFLWPQSASGQNPQVTVAVELLPPCNPSESEQRHRGHPIAANPLSPSRQLVKSLKHSARMACCFCCCPVYRCVLWFCAFELICSFYLWYSQLSDLIRIYSAAELKDILGLLILSGWLVTLTVSTVSILIAHRKGDPQWVLPRLVQQSGLLILGFMMALLLVVYFAGGAQAINNLLISIYEGLYSDPLSRDSRQGVQEDLRFYFLLSIIFTFCFICYMAAALCATKKYYRELQITGGGRPFQPVSQSAPPPQPPVNPYYKYA